MKNQRNNNIEVFRCLLMFMVVLSHAFCHGRWQSDTSLWTLIYSTLIIWHVDGFVAISGWFGIRFSWRKLLNLWGIIAFYTILGAAYLFVFDRCNFSVKSIVIHGGWFTGTYMMLMLLSPIVNAGLEGLAKTSKKSLVAAWCAFTFGMIANWAPAHLMTGINAYGVGSYSLVTLLYVYITARCARLLELDKLPLRKFLSLPVAFFLGIMIMGGMQILYMYLKGNVVVPADLKYWTNYDSPHVVGMAIGMLLLFASYIKVPERLGRMAAFCAPSMFGVYVMSDTTAFGPKIYQYMQNLCPYKGGVIWVLLTALVTYTVCLLFDLMRHCIVKSMDKRLKGE